MFLFLARLFCFKKNRCTMDDFGLIMPSCPVDDFKLHDGKQMHTPAGLARPWIQTKKKLTCLDGRQAMAINVGDA